MGICGHAANARRNKAYNPWDEKPKLYEYNEGYSGYDEDEMDAWLEKVVDLYTKELCVQQDRIVELKEKAEKWDEYAIYDNDNEPLITVAELLKEHEKLEAIKTWYDNLDVTLEGNRVSFTLFEFSNLKMHLEVTNICRLPS